ncbi:MAG: hypothetical protein ABR581_05005 [Thermoleophilaceae bacterium]
MIVPGAHPADPAQAAATSALLRALCMSPEQAAAAARVPLADLQALLDGTGHALAWAALAERLCAAAGSERDQTPPQPLRRANLRQLRRQASAYGTGVG